MKVEFQLGYFTRPPDSKAQKSSVGSFFRFLDGISYTLPCIALKKFSADTEDDIIYVHNSIGRCFWTDMGYKNLATASGGSALLAIEIICGLGKDPAAKPGGT